MNINMTQAIITYHNSQVGDGWDDFWDYKCAAEQYSDICSGVYIQQTSDKLKEYLRKFGMTRKSKVPRLQQKDWEDILRGIRPSYISVKDITMETIQESHRRDVLRLVYDLAFELDSRKVSPTYTLVTKILLALWGQVPAWDAKVKNAFTAYLKPTSHHLSQPTKAGYSLPFDLLLDLQKNYNNQWKQDFFTLRDQYQITRTSGQNPIPPARLIDMALWQMG